VQLVGQHGLQDSPRPPIRGVPGGVPLPNRLVVEPVQQHHNVAPGQLCSSLLHFLRPRLGEGPHVVQVPASQAAGVGETCPQVGGEPLDHPGAPPLLGLPLQDEGSDAPIHADQLGVDCARGPNSAPRNLGLHRLQQRNVIRGLYFPVHRATALRSRAAVR